VSGTNQGDDGKTPPKPPQVPRSSGTKRDKELARLKAERQAAKRAERQAAQRKQAIWGGAIAIVIVGLLIGLIAWQPWKSNNTAALPTPTPTASLSTPTPTATPNVHVAGCVTPPATRTTSPTYKQPPKIDAAKGSVINLNTNCGVISIQTDPVRAPGTSRNMLGLAEAGFFNLTRCHRLTTTGIYVLQCGDPKGDGTGGPGYSIKDENLPKKTANNYPAGTVAMANSGPNTGGSQFFIVYKNTTLGPNYAIWGHVVKGLDRVQAVAGAGSDNANGTGDGHPNQPVVIVTATVSKR